MKHARGSTLIDTIVVISITAILAAGVLAGVQTKYLDRDIEITRQNALRLLDAGRTYYSVNRAFPTSVATLVSQGYTGSNIVPANPLGDSFAVLGTTISGDIGHVLVRATVTRGGDINDMVKRLDANRVVAGNEIEWRGLTKEFGSGSSSNLERFRSAYGGGSTLEISSNMANYNIATMLGSPTSPVNVTLTIPSGVTVSSNSAATAALDTGPLPSGSTVTIVNNGTIVGGGGNGGDGGGPCLVTAPTSGANGGNAINTTVTISIENTNGYIYGGGGGGGGGATTCASFSSGGGGGGGGGGSGGTSSFGTAGSGTTTAGGAGVVGNTDSYGYPLTGGNGGWPGESGNVGLTGFGNGHPAGAGGAPGKAINLNGQTITWLGGNDATRVKGAVN
jgi:hypothetical protein